MRVSVTRVAFGVQKPDDQGSRKRVAQVVFQLPDDMPEFSTVTTAGYSVTWRSLTTTVVFDGSIDDDQAYVEFERIAREQLAALWRKASILVKSVTLGDYGWTVELVVVGGPERLTREATIDANSAGAAIAAAVAEAEQTLGELVAAIGRMDGDDAG